MVSFSIYGQIESGSPEQELSKEEPMSNTTGFVGYDFYEGGFMGIRLSNTQQLHFGIVHTYVEDYKVVELPVILKQILFKDFHAFFGGRLNSTINAGFGKSASAPFTKPTLGGSFEMGFQ